MHLYNTGKQSSAEEPLYKMGQTSVLETLRRLFKTFKNWKDLLLFLFCLLLKNLYKKRQGKAIYYPCNCTYYWDYF